MRWLVGHEPVQVPHCWQMQDLLASGIASTSSVKTLWSSLALRWL